MSEKKCREAKDPNRGVIGECWPISEDGNHLLKMVVLMTMLTMMMMRDGSGGEGGLLGNIIRRQKSSGDDGCTCLPPQL